VAGFRATRETSRVPLLTLPDGFEHRVLEAERAVTRELPFRARVARAFTIASGYAMRPQLAMAALLLLVVGASLTVLRPTPGSHGSVQVTEHGAPESERELVVPIEEAEEQVALQEAPLEKEAKTTATPAELADTPVQPGQVAEDPTQDQARAEAEDRAYAAAMEAYRGGDHESAQRQFDAIVQSAGRNANAAELYAAYATEKAAGCSAALPRFDSVSAKNEANDLGHQATWQSATCRVQLGQEARARRDLEQLQRVPAYAQRARDALERLAGEGRESSLLSSRRVDNKESLEPPAAAAPQAAPGAKSSASAPVMGPVAESAPSKRAASPRKSKAKSKNSTAKPTPKRKVAEPLEQSASE
jgi:hypothetical protein